MNPISIAVFIALLEATVLAWGPDGHRIVAAVAEALLTRNSKNQINKLIPGQSLVDIANWADQADHTPEYAWSKCMHFVDSDHGACAVDIQSSCGGPHGCCVINAIANYTERLGNADLSTDMRVEALKFLVHFTGDAAQPLHAGSKQDRGGNEIHVKPEFKQTERELDTHSETNLHSVWDTTIIEEFMREKSFTFTDFAKRILDSITTNPKSEIWTKECDITSRNAFECPLESAEESASLACEFAYVNAEGTEIRTGDILDREYYLTRVPVVEDRLASAGVRLGSILNSVFHEPSLAQLPELEVL